MFSSAICETSAFSAILRVVSDFVPMEFPVQVGACVRPELVSDDDESSVVRRQRAAKYAGGLTEKASVLVPISSIARTPTNVHSFTVSNISLF